MNCPRCIAGMLVRTPDIASPLRCINCGACGVVINPRTTEELASLTSRTAMPLEYRPGQYLYDEYSPLTNWATRRDQHASS